MKWTIVATMLLLTGCASGLGGDAACAATRDQRAVLAGALLDDAGANARREGAKLIAQLDAVCVDTGRIMR